MTKSLLQRSSLLALVFVLAACGGAESEVNTKTSKGNPDAFPSDLFTTTAPEGAIDIHAAIAAAKPGESIVVRGVIGGRKQAFVGSSAIFVAVDTALISCEEEEGCPTPWDYCCTPQEQLVANTLTIQVVDKDGNPITSTLKGVGGMKELKTVVVSGKVRSTEGTVIVDAERIHVVGD